MDSAASVKSVSPPKGRRLSFATIPRKIRWIIYVNAAGGLNFGYLMIFITGYYPEIGIGPGTIGLLLGAEGAAMVTFAIPLGLYSDRYGRKLPLLDQTTAEQRNAAFALSFILGSVAGGVGLRCRSSSRSSRRRRASTARRSTLA